MGQANYLSARSHHKQVELYAWDLLWSIASRNLQGDAPMPSEIWHEKNKIDRRSAKQIVSDLLNNLGGE